MRGKRRIDDLEVLELVTNRLRVERNETPTVRPALQVFGELQIEVDKFSETLRDLEGDARKSLLRIAVLALRAVTECT